MHVSNRNVSYKGDIDQRSSMWGSKWGNNLQLVLSNCVLNHMLIPWVSEVIYYCHYLEFGIICMFLTSFYAHFCILCAQLVG